MALTDVAFLPGVLGGWVKDVVFDPSNPEKLYFGLINSVASYVEVHVSGDGGQTSEVLGTQSAGPLACELASLVGPEDAHSSVSSRPGSIR